jgi:hypothetical protein
MAARYLTVRNVPVEIARALDKERRHRGTSLNQTVLDLLGQGLGVGSAAGRSNGLRRLAGTWSEAELAEFEAAVGWMEQVDPELWS